MSKIIFVKTRRYSTLINRIFKEYKENVEIYIEGHLYTEKDIPELANWWCNNRIIKRTVDFTLKKGGVELFGFHDTPDLFWAAMSEQPFVEGLAKEKIVRYKVYSEKPKRRKISLLAIASIVIPVMGLIIGSLSIFCLKCRCCGILEIVFGIILLPMAFLVLIGPVLGFLAFIHTLLSRKSYKGYLLAALGIAMFVPAVRWGPGRAMLWIREEASIQLCQRDMMTLGEAVRAYSKEHNGQYPEANQWCDLLLEYVDSNHIVISILRPYGEKKNYYALNPNAILNSPSDVVLLFETLSDWNQFGGPSLLIDEHHRGFGCNILFNDGHVEFIPPRKFDKLNWGDDQDNK